MPQECTVPIFPLDGVLLCPGLLLPLHVFEQRYRSMLAFAIGKDKRIAMACPAIGHSTTEQACPPVHEICGLGEIIQHQTLPDGRSNILLRGESRLKILEELPRTQEFRVVHGAFIPELLNPGEDFSDLTEELISIVSAFAPDARETLDQLPPQEMVDSVLTGCQLPTKIKLEIYSNPQVEVRLRQLVEYLRRPQGPSLEFLPDDPRRN